MTGGERVASAAPAAETRTEFAQDHDLLARLIASFRSRMGAIGGTVVGLQLAPLGTAVPPGEAPAAVYSTRRERKVAELISAFSGCVPASGFQVLHVGFMLVEDSELPRGEKWEVKVEFVGD